MYLIFAENFLNMAKIEMLQRLLLIVNKLSNKRATYVPTDELIDYVEKNMRIRYSDAAGSTLRTIQRDLLTIDSLFGISVKNKKGYGYFINERLSASPEKYEELLLNFDLLSALDADSGLQNYVLAEHHRPRGSLHISALMDAIRKCHPVEFDYTYVRHGNKLSRKKVCPHFLKESNQLWYLLAYDGTILKTFGLDRISNLAILEDEKFKRNNDIVVEDLFKDCYGIWDQEDIPVEDIVLSYDALDGTFLKTMPLHHSQQILTDTDEEFRIRLRLRITNDFVMELLSRSRSLTVHEPLSLRERIHTIYTEALRRNSIENIEAKGTDKDIN
jgi:predicted DNA-binding transcriptional regulator YafY